MSSLRLVFISLSILIIGGFTWLVLAGRSEENLTFRSLGNLAEVLHLVQTSYVDEQPPEQLEAGLAAGLVQSLDPWAMLIEEMSAEELARITEGRPGFGLVVGYRLSNAAVRQALPGSPAAEAELLLGEVIEKIDGVPTRGRPLWDARLQLIRAEAEGRSVTLTVVDREVDERREVSLDPKSWEIQPFELETLAEDTTSLRIEALGEGTVDQLRRALEEMPDILDLRKLGWGLETQAIEVADLFVEDGSLGSWAGRKAGEAGFEAKPGRISGELPLVLISRETEGVGEILAAALDHAGATLVGASTSIGHAPHMQLVEGGGFSVWMPVGQWLDGEGESLDDGLEPDELIELLERPADDEDPVLDAALEMLSGDYEPAQLAEAA